MFQRSSDIYGALAGLWSTLPSAEGSHSETVLGVAKGVHMDAVLMYIYNPGSREERFKLTFNNPWFMTFYCIRDERSLAHG